MMRSVCTLSVSLFAITLGASAHASTKVTESFQVNSRGLNAAFSGTDNCTAASMNVYFSEIAADINGVPLDNPPNTFVVIDYVNICNGAAFQLSGTTFQQQFTIANDLSSATLYAVVPVITDEGAPVPLSTTVTVNLRFTATGATTKYKQKEHSNVGGVKFKLGVSSDSRPAEATGSGLLDLPFAGGDDTQIVLAPSVDGLISKNMFGQITVTRTKN